MTAFLLKRVREWKHMFTQRLYMNIYRNIIHKSRKIKKKKQLFVNWWMGTENVVSSNSGASLSRKDERSTETQHKWTLDTVWSEESQTPTPHMLWLRFYECLQETNLQRNRVDGWGQGKKIVQVTTYEHGVLLGMEMWNNWRALMVSELSEYTKTHLTVHFEKVALMWNLKFQRKELST